MSVIYIACPDCTSDTSMPARILLATPDLREFLGPLGQLSWACLSCGRLVTAEREVAHLLRRITAGVSRLDEGFGGGVVAEDDTGSRAPLRPVAEPSNAGRLFTSQDILTLHELLETDAWIRQLDEPPRGSS